MSHDVVRRWIDRALVGELPARRQGPLLDHVRSCAACRAHYDRGALALRALEHVEGPTEFELGVVADRLFAGTGALPIVDGASWRAKLRSSMSRGLMALAGVGVAALALLWISPESETGGLGEFIAKGGRGSTGLGLMVFCGEPLRPAADSGCRVDESLTVAYRVGQPSPASSLVLFGVDAEGDRLYYAPTPVDTANLPIESGAWQPVGFTVDLGVNHVPGPLTIYGLVTTNAVDADDVDVWARELATTLPVDDADADAALAPGQDAEPNRWTQRLSRELIAGQCEPESCLAAEFSLVLHEARR